MRDYIAEANRFMYDDSYISESIFILNGKEFPSKNAAILDLKKHGLSGQKLDDAISKGKFKEHNEIVNKLKDLSYAHGSIKNKEYYLNATKEEKNKRRVLGKELTSVKSEIRKINNDRKKQGLEPIELPKLNRLGVEYRDPTDDENAVEIAEIKKSISKGEKHFRVNMKSDSGEQDLKNILKAVQQIGKTAKVEEEIWKKTKFANVHVN